MGQSAPLADAVAVVTGAGSGIGRAAALAYARRGARVAVTDVSGERAEEVARQIRDAGGQAIPLQLDVGDRDQVRRCAERLGPVDILHSNAGVALGAPFTATTLEDWEWITRVNYWGTVYGINAFLPAMLERRSGHILITASFLGLTGTPGACAYTATKYALVGLGESLRAELAPHRIGVSVLCPGVVDTRILADGKTRLDAPGKVSRAGLERLFARFGRPPERVAEAAVRAIERNLGLVPVGPEAWAAWLLKRLSQGLYEWAVKHLARRAL